MTKSVGELSQIAQSTRSDFEAVLITDDQILEAAGEAKFLWMTSTIEGRGKLTFPTRYCTYATLILRNRIGYGEIIRGGFAKHESVFDEWHSFLDIGSTALSAETIIDITSDQFDGGVPVYVGPLELPWKKVARLEEWEGIQPH